MPLNVTLYGQIARSLFYQAVSRREDQEIHIVITKGLAQLLDAAHEIHVLLARVHLACRPAKRRKLLLSSRKAG